MSKTITIVDTGADRYTVDYDTNILGRQYDNDAETLTIVKPETEANNACLLIATANGQVIDHIVVGNEPINITSNLSKYQRVEIGFCFTNQSGYVKNSEIKSFRFLPAQIPDDFEPVEPEVKTQITTVIAGAFLSATYDIENHLIKFFNLNNELVGSLDVTQFAGADYDELLDKPKINDVTLEGNKTSEELGLLTSSDIANDVTFDVISSSGGQIIIE